VRPSLADPVGYARANVTGTASVAEAARRAKVSRILFGSSSSVYGDSTPAPFREDAVAIEPVSPYAATKRAGELFLRSVAPIYGFRVASLRFFTVYGPRQRPDLAIHSFTRKMLAGETITLFGDGTQARDYTYCDDIVVGVLAALRWSADAPVGVEDFNLGGNRSVPTGAMVEEISRALGIKPLIQWAPMQPGDVQQTAADLTKSGAVLGYAPRTPFPEGIRRFVAWFRESYGRPD
jgi:UDP-glucuronate 4-epimerase